MRDRLRAGVPLLHVFALLLLSALFVPASTAQRPEPAVVSRVKVVLDEGSPRIEITSSRSLAPTILQADDPTRLLVDLPNSVISVDRKSVDVQSDDISLIELQQNATNPPGVRLNIKTRHPLTHEWYSAGNRLIIRFRKAEEIRTSDVTHRVAPSRPTPVSVPVPDALPPGVVLEADLKAGAPVVANEAATTVRLTRGGEIRVCPGSSISLMHSKTGPDLLVSMNQGAIEMHYRLANLADSVVTPDFRVLLRGPGEFHYAVRADARGNTCVRALPGATGRAIIYELMDNGTFQVTSSHQSFSRVKGPYDAGFSAERCGCPETPPGVLRAALAEPTLIPVAPEGPVGPSLLPNQGTRSSSLSPTKPATPPVVPAAESYETVSLPARPGEVRTVVEAPLVYRATDNLTAESPNPDSSDKLDSNPQDLKPEVNKRARKNGRGFFGGVKRFFGSIFR